MSELFLSVMPNRLKIYWNVSESFINILDHNFRGVYLQSLHAIEYFNALNAGKKRILYAKERDHFLPFAIFYSQHSCLQRSFNRYLMRLVTAGLIGQWETHFTKQPPKLENVPTKQLNVHQIAGILWIALFLYICCFLIFLIEVISPYHSHIARIIDFFTFR